VLRLRSQLPLLVVPLLLAAPVGAACDSGASLLLVPEDCGSVKDAVAAIASGGTVDIAAGTTTLGAALVEIAGGGSSTRDWTTLAGTFLAAYVDRGVGTTGALASAPTGALAGSVTYRRVAMTREGGAYSEVRVYVDEPALDPVFADDFDLGTLAAWSSSVGG